MTKKQKRTSLILGGLLLLGAIVSLMLFALSENIAYFNSPSDIVERGITPGKRIRLGGMVAEGSVKRGTDAQITFDVTDFAETASVTYRGLVPDLFREGQGVIVEGAFNDKGLFIADTVLAKHDENYTPPEITDALKRAGDWQGKGEDKGLSHDKKYGEGSYP